MTSRINRRHFIKTAGAAATGVAVATTYAPLSYAQNERVRVACIGTGSQGIFHICNGMAGAQGIEIAAVCDIFEPHLRAAAVYAQVSNAGIPLSAGQSPRDLDPALKEKAKAQPRPASYLDYREMLAKEDFDAAVIATPLHTHYPIAAACLDAGKFVFCEKTLTQTIEEGRALVTKCHETGKFIQAGHQRRYNPKYNLGVKLAYEDGMLGRITHITAQWHRNHFWRRDIRAQEASVTEEDRARFQELGGVADLEHLLNWRVYEETSGGLFTEMAAHQVDIANWFLRSCPKRVRAFGGLDYWRDDRSVDDNIALTYEYELNPGDDGFMMIDARSLRQRMSKINKTYAVRFACSSILTNAQRGASELIQGDYGTLELSQGVCRLYGEDAIVEQDESDPADMASVMTRSAGNPDLAEGVDLLSDRVFKSSDVYQFEAFAQHIKDGSTPRSNQMVGLTTAVAVLAGRQSRKEDRTVDIDPAWCSFDFKVPGIYDYHHDADLGEKIEAPVEDGAQ